MFVRDCWYVAAWDHELEAGKPIGRTLIGEAVVIYRAETGGLVALADRCCHRFAPLSLGRVEGDELRCMYHGLKFDRSGRCTEIRQPDRLHPPFLRPRQFLRRHRGLRPHPSHGRAAGTRGAHLALDERRPA